MKSVVIFCLFLLGFQKIEAQSIPPSKPLTDEVQIRLVLHKIEQGIKEQNVLKVTDGFAKEVESNGKTINRKTLSDEFKNTFNSYQTRKDDPSFIKLKPPRISLTTTWDFEMDIDEIKFLNDNTALAKTWIYFAAAEPDTTNKKWKFGKKRRNNFMFRKVKEEWRIRGLDSFFDKIQKIR